MRNGIIYIFGDICPRWGNSREFDTGDKTKVFHDILKEINGADLVLANLECPVTDSEVKLNKNSMNLKSCSEDLILLKSAGISGVSLANNHILDYDVAGFNDTLKNLDDADIFYYGIQKYPNDVFIKEINDKKVGIIAFAEHEFNCAVDYGVGANCWSDIDGILSIVKAKSKCDYLIVQYHGGIEEYKYPSPQLQKRCRSIAEAGADLILCQHSHCVGTREVWGNTEILYGQGNSIFGYDPKNKMWNDGLLVKVELENGKVTYIPIESRKDGEYLKTREEAELFLQVFFDRSSKILSSEFIKNEWNSFCKKQKHMYFPMLLCWDRYANKLNRILKGILIEKFINPKAKQTLMNLIRCDSHREVIITILEDEYYKTMTHL